MIKKFIPIIFVIVIPFFQLVSFDKCKVLESISNEEKAQLERLFYQLIEVDHFGYTLLGSKPVSMAAFFTITPYENVLECGGNDAIFWKMWNIWKKHFDQFKTPNFLLFEENSSTSGIGYIFLIHKQAFITTVQQHVDLFSAILGYSVDPHTLLQQVESKQLSFLDIIHHNETLLGILLGYGKKNAILYTQVSKIAKNKSLNFFGEYEFSLRRISTPHFVADLKDPETMHLKMRYEADRKILSEIYAQQNFLEATLEKLSG